MELEKQNTNENKCFFSKCDKTDHTNCMKCYRQMHSDRVKQYYHEKYKNEFLICDCGEKISKANKNHIKTEKHRKLLQLKRNEEIRQQRLRELYPEHYQYQQQQQISSN